MTTTAAKVAQDPRIQPGQCGTVTTVGGHEFVCIAPPHEDASPQAEYMRVYRGQRPRSDYHYFIRKHPDGG